MGSLGAYPEARYTTQQLRHAAGAAVERRTAHPAMGAGRPYSASNATSRAARARARWLTLAPHAAGGAGAPPSSTGARRPSVARLSGLTSPRQWISAVVLRIQCDQQGGEGPGPVAHSGSPCRRRRGGPSLFYRGSPPLGGPAQPGSPHPANGSRRSSSASNATSWAARARARWLTLAPHAAGGAGAPPSSTGARRPSVARLSRAHLTPPMDLGGRPPHPMRPAGRRGPGPGGSLHPWRRRSPRRR